MHPTLHKIYTAIIHTLFPPICTGCEAIGSYLCKDCKKTLVAHPEQCLFCHAITPDYQVCYACRNEQSTLQGIIIGFSYTSVIKKLIIDLKFGHRSHVAPYLAERLHLLLQTHPQVMKAYQAKKLLISYVPSHRIRKHFIKGYNQSELLAEALATLMGLPCQQVARRVQYTTSQTKLNRTQRRKNLVRAFRSHTPETNIVGNETLLIVDDITTTGSTLIHTAKSIKKDHPGLEVWGVVVARNR